MRAFLRLVPIASIAILLLASPPLQAMTNASPCSKLLATLKAGHYWTNGYYDLGQQYGPNFGATGWVDWGGELRSFYTFTIPDSSRPLRSAELLINMGSASPNFLNAIVDFYEVSTPPTSLGSFTTSPSIFNDLGDGELFASLPISIWDVSANGPGGVLRIPLSNAGLNLISEAAGGGWSVGARLRGAVTNHHHIFGRYYLTSAQLLLTYESSGAPVIELDGPVPPRNLLAGERFAIRASVCGDLPLNVQWLKDGVPFRNGPELDIPQVALADEGTYQLRAANALGTNDSTGWSLSIVPFRIADLPPTYEIPFGVSASPWLVPILSAPVTSLQPVEYQWRKNGIPIPSANTPQFFFHNVSESSVGDYDVVVWNSLGIQTSTVSRVQIAAHAPTVPSATQSPVAIIGFPLTLDPGLYQGTAPLTYQWSKDNLPLSQTGPQLELPPISAALGGVYTVTIQNQFGRTNVTFQVNPAPIQLMMEASYSIREHEPYLLIPQVRSASPTSFQWFREGIEIPDATNSTLLFNPARLRDSGRYTVRARAGGGEVNYSTQVEVARVALSYTTLPGTPQVGSPLLLRPAPPIHFTRAQWYKDDQPLASQTNRNLYISSASEADNGLYRVDYESPSGAIRGSDYSVTVQNGPVISDAPPFFPFWPGNPWGFQYTQGSTVELGVTPDTIISASPVTLQWRRNGTNLPGETNSTLLLTNVQPSASASYQLVASNSHGAILINQAITVSPLNELDRWHWRQPAPQGSRLFTVAYGNGRFVATGRSGNVVVSTNGLDWGNVSLDPRLDLTELTFEQGHFRARGGSPWYYHPTLHLTSMDGSTWDFRRGSTSNLHDITITPALSLARDPSGNLLYSTNALGWNISSQAPAYSWDLAAGNGRFVILGQNSIFTSSDGLSWASATNAAHLWFSDVAFGLDKFVAIPATPPGQSYPEYLAENPSIHISVDGLSWERIVTPGPPDEILYADDSIIIATVLESPGDLLVSLNGTDWQKVSTGGRQAIHSIAFGAGRFVAVGSGGTLASSSDGLAWSGIDPAISIDLFGIAQGTNNTTVAVGEDGKILVSTNGSDWSSVVSGTTEFLRSVHYANGTYLAVGNDGVILTSTDALAWTKRSSGTDSDLRRASYGNGLWVAAGEDGILLTSPDTITWQSHPVTHLWPVPSEHEGVAYGNGTWVVVGGYFFPSAVGTILISTNGRDWRQVSTFIGKRLRDVTYGNGRFMAVGNDGVILSSTDGLIWEWAFSVIGNSRRVIFANGRFVVIGNDGQIASSRTLLGPWRNHAGPSSQNLHDIVFRPDGTFVAVGNNGMIIQSDSAYPIFHSVRLDGTSINLDHTSYVPGTILEESADLRTWTQLPLTTTITTPSGKSRFFRLRTAE